MCLTWRWGIWWHISRPITGLVEALSGRPLHPPSPYPRLYRVSIPWEGGSVKRPVEGFGGRVSTQTKIQIHFMHLHLQDTIAILEEGNQPHPHLLSCDMFIIWVVMKNHQPNNRALHVGGRKEATTAGRGGGTVRGGNGVPIVRTATGNSDILQLTWITSYCNNK